jgi:glycosyltransferase involved in cell wall biosynthesis
LKVAHLCGSADTRIGGSLPVARDLVASQVERGIDARLVLLYRSLTPPEPDPSRVPSLCLDIDRSQRYTKGIAALRRVLREFRPDIIHHHDGLLWPRIVTPGLGVPLVMHGHSEAPKTWSRRMVLPLALRGTRRMLAVSQWTADGWVEAGFPREKISVVLNGVDSRRFRRRSEEARRAKLSTLGVNPEVRILLWAGRLERERKGLDRLIRVGKALPRDWACVVAGDGSARDWLSAQIGELPNRSQFHMLGNVSSPEEWFGIADAYLFTSPAEPFGLVILEAAASEVPILGFACSGGAMQLLAELGAEMVDDYDEARLANLFRNMDRSDRTTVARRIVEESYSWDSVADRTIAIYRELMDGAP